MPLAEKFSILVLILSIGAQWRYSESVIPAKLVLAPHQVRGRLQRGLVRLVIPAELVLAKAGSGNPEPITTGFPIKSGMTEEEGMTALVS